jgi:hypothetical protein
MDDQSLGDQGTHHHDALPVRPSGFIDGGTHSGDQLRQALASVRLRVCIRQPESNGLRIRCSDIRQRASSPRPEVAGAQPCHRLPWTTESSGSLSGRRLWAVTPPGDSRRDRRDRRWVHQVARVAEDGLARTGGRSVRDHDESLCHGQGPSWVVVICREIVRPTKRDTNKAT